MSQYRVMPPPIPFGQSAVNTNKVLRNTYTLLAMTLDVLCA